MLQAASIKGLSSDDPSDTTSPLAQGVEGNALHTDSKRNWHAEFNSTKRGELAFLLQQMNCSSGRGMKKGNR